MVMIGRYHLEEDAAGYFMDIAEKSASVQYAGTD